MNKIYFISGVNGVGKSTIMPFLNVLFSADKFEIHDFDERGVPENADGKWRISETKHWVNKGIKLAQENKSIVICGFVKIADFPDLKSPEIVKIFLDAEPELIRQRLIKRYTKNGVFDDSQKVIGKPIEEFIGGNIWILSQMKKAFAELNCPIIDTTNLTPEEVAREVVNIILEKKTMKLKGEKIYLQEGLLAENYPLLLRWFTDIELVNYLSFAKRVLELKNVSELKTFIDEIETGPIFGIYNSNNDSFIGYASLGDFKDGGQCEFSIFILDKNYWGKGVGSEVIELMLEYAFNDLNMKKVVLETSELHKSAIRLYEKAGFKKTQLLPNDRMIYHERNWVVCGSVKMEIAKPDFLKIMK